MRISDWSSDVCSSDLVGPYIEHGLIGCDVAFVQLSPADENGQHSFGLISDYTRAAVDKARVVIAEINDQIPFTFGETIAAAENDVAIHVSRTPVDVGAARIGENDEAIATFAAPYIGTGPGLQRSEERRVGKGRDR